MEIRSKEQFIRLLVGTMAIAGTLVDTFDFNEDIWDIMQDRRFNPLFYFFKNRKDFDFTKELNKYVYEDLLYYSFLEDGILVIKLGNKMFDGTFMLKDFDNELIRLMILFLRENSLNQRLTGILPQGVKGKYSLINPNGVFNIGENERIISNGEMEEIRQDSILVENASFTVLQELRDKKVVTFNLLYPFEDSNYIFRIMRNVSNMDIPIGYHEETFRSDLVKEREKFQEIKRARVFKYNVL